MTAALGWAAAVVAALAALGLAAMLRALNRLGIEAVWVDVPDTVPAAWVEMEAQR